MASNETLCLAVKGRPNGCVFWQVETVFLILLGSIAVVLNVLQFRTLFHNRKFRPIVTEDLLTGVLTVVNLFTALVPIFAYVFAHHGYSTTTGQIPNSRSSPNNGCVTFYVTFAWSKLCVLFLTAAFVYTSYLQYTNNSRSGSKLYSRTGTLQSQKSFASVNSGTCSCSTKRLTRDQVAKLARYAPRKTISLTLTIVIFGIVFVSLIVSSLPFLGLGPQMNKGAQTADNLNNNTTNTVLETGVCSLSVFVVPQNEKEYTYLFAVIMSSTASFLLQAFCLCACVFHHKTNKFPRHQLRKSFQTKTTDDIRAEESSEEPSLAKAEWPPEELETVIIALVIGMAFFLTWTPLIVTLYLAVAGNMVSERLVTIFLLISFTNLVVDPLVYGGLSRECRKAHKEFFATTIWTKLKNAGSVSERTASRVTDQEV